jgi:hypothetical protein
MDWSARRLVGIVGVVLAAMVILSSSAGAAAPRTSSEPTAYRWTWFDGPYHGNPDEPGIDRPQRLEPQHRDFHKQCAPVVILPVLGSNLNVIAVVVVSVAGEMPVLRFAEIRR